MILLSFLHRSPLLLFLSCMSFSLLGNPLPLFSQSNEVQKLNASDAATEDFFGAAVSMSGDVAVVGAQFHDDIGSNSGSAYVYRFNGISWVEEQKLLASDSSAGDSFGISVSTNGELIVVGAIGNDDAGSASGSAYVYRFNGTTWLEEQKLLASDGASGDVFGESVSTGSEVVVVGTRNSDDNGNSSGSAYVYRFNGTIWVEEQKLLPSDNAAGDEFGFSASISGDVAVVSARLDDDNGASSGSVYIFRFNGIDWVEEQKLLASDGASGDVFGESVSLSGDVALVGAAGSNDNGENSGSTYVYRFDGSSWVEEQKLLPSDAAAGDIFGGSVSVHGDVATVGAALDDDAGSSSGSAYLYRFNGIAWVEEQKLLASDAAPEDLFGQSVSVGVNAILIGAAGNDDNGSNSGSAYLLLPSVLLDFVRSDCNEDGVIDISDPTRLLGVLFLGDAPISCEQACDTNDSDTLDIVDVFANLMFLFQSGAGPLPPFPGCGPDPTQGTLTCEMFPSCP